MKVAYPRLPRAIAEAELQRVAEAHAGGGLNMVRDLVRYDHERKRPVATGRIATTDEIRNLRKAVVEDLAVWIDRGGVASQEAAFDNALGLALHRELNIIPSDAAHEDTWSFLTIVVFPDLAVLRFPAIHRDRFLGTHRNALRRTWQRQDVLGPMLQRNDDRALGEDELVGLFERSAMVRNRMLARSAAETVCAYEGPNRSKWARKLYKAISYQTGARLLDTLNEPAIRELVDQAACEASSLSDDADD
jgi:hypothetical protein